MLMVRYQVRGRSRICSRDPGWEAGVPVYRLPSPERSWDISIHSPLPGVSRVLLMSLVGFKFLLRLWSLSEGHSRLQDFDNNINLCSPSSLL